MGGRRASLFKVKSVTRKVYRGAELSRGGDQQDFPHFFRGHENKGSRFRQGLARGGPIPVFRPNKSCLIPSAIA